MPLLLPIAALAYGSSETRNSAYPDTASVVRLGDSRRRATADSTAATATHWTSTRAVNGCAGVPATAAIAPGARNDATVATPIGANDSPPEAYPIGFTISWAAIGTAMATAMPITQSHGAVAPAANAVTAPSPAATPDPIRSSGRRSARSAPTARRAATPTMRAGIATTATPVSRTTAATTSRAFLRTGRPRVGAANRARAISTPAIAANTAPST